jgi:outer membrane protein TolC
MPLSAPAQPAAVPPTTVAATSILGLNDALQLALKLNPALRVARDQVRLEHGSLSLARAAFDATLQTSLVGGRYRDLSLGAGTASSGIANIATSRRETVDYRVGVQKQFSNGVILVPSVTVSQLAQPVAGGLPVNRSEAGVTAIVPLARNRGGSVDAVQQQSYERALDAAEYERRQAVARVSLDVGLAYWDYAAAGERLAVQRYSESRAQTLVDETEELVRGGARPAADLIQFRGNLATKRTQRVSAEQAVARSRQHVGNTLGLSPAEMLALPPARLDVAGTAAPYDPSTGTVNAPTVSVDSAPTDPDKAGVTWARRMASDVLARRPDVRAVRERAQAALQLQLAAQSAMRPQMDLQVSFAYAGLDRGLGVNEFGAPLWRNTRGATTTIQLQYSLPALNLAARGRAETAEAIAAQAATTERDRARQVEAALAVAVAGLYRSRAALVDAAAAVRIAREVVENEKQKFRLGVSTQIDVIYAEDALTNALLNEISARAAYASSIGVLRLESGALATVGEDTKALSRLLSTDTDLRRMP